MTMLKQDLTTINIEYDITQNPAWYGKIAGLVAEKSLRGRQPYVYLIRAGEYPLNYYASFVLPDLSIRHQPFVITIHQNEWYYENAAGGGPYNHESINDVIHLIMHCKEGESAPLVRFDIK